jgi:hypothetical protein
MTLKKKHPNVKRNQEVQDRQGLAIIADGQVSTTEKDKVRTFLG